MMPNCADCYDPLLPHLEWANRCDPCYARWRACPQPEWIAQGLDKPPPPERVQPPVWQSADPLPTQEADGVAPERDVPSAPASTSPAIELPPKRQQYSLL